MLHIESRLSKTQASILYTLHNQNLSETDSAKYLGLTITSDLQWNQHINNRSLNGCICMCFLDASKAFDRVKHSVLFSKLVRRGVPGYIVRLLCYWYDRQAMCVIWGNSLSDPFHVNNGVRQGGILSPYLFNVYMDDLSQSLNCCKTGCLSGEIMINHLMYADDLVLLSPSATGLRELLLACEKYSKEHAII